MQFKEIITAHCGNRRRNTQIHRVGYQQESARVTGPACNNGFSFKRLNRANIPPREITVSLNARYGVDVSDSQKAGKKRSGFVPEPKYSVPINNNRQW
jgi:hypothetical protein